MLSFYFQVARNGRAYGVQFVKKIFKEDERCAARLIFRCALERGNRGSVERDGDMVGAAAHCLWQQSGREGIKTISSLVLLL